jgi:hypothetical protein
MYLLQYEIQHQIFWSLFHQDTRVYLTTNPSADLPRGKKLTFAFYSSKHQTLGQASNCNSKLIADFFDQKFKTSVELTYFVG